MKGNGVCRARRMKLGLTQQTFASLLGLSFVSVNRWENKPIKPSGLSAVIFTMLDSALKRHPPAHVVQELRKAAGAPVALVLILAKLVGEEP